MTFCTHVRKKEGKKITVKIMKIRNPEMARNHQKTLNETSYYNRIYFIF